MVEPHWLLDQSYIMDSVKKGACVAAMNDNGEILAVRLGVVKNRNDYLSWIFEKAFSWFFSFSLVCSFLPQSMNKLEHTTLTSLDYDDFRDENG